MRNIDLVRLDDVPVFRRLALAAWGAPSDPTVYGSIEIDATHVLAHVERLRSSSGEHVTLTHVVGRAIAKVLAEYPEANVVVRWGAFYRRKSVDVFFQVALPPEPGRSAMAADLSGTVVRQADRKSVVAIARELRQRARRVRTGADAELSRTRNTLRHVPGWLLRPLVRLLGFVQYTLNVRLPGMPRDAFGSVMVTSVGMFGIRHGYAPLFPPSRCPMVVLVGAVQPRPWVVGEPDAPQVAVRPVLPIHVAFDHRILDGYQAARLAARLQELLTDPSHLDDGVTSEPELAPSA